MMVCDIRTRMPAAELTQWIAFNTLEPIGQWRDDNLAGRICAVVANTVRTKPPFAKPSDFMPVQKAALPPPTPEQMKASMKAWALSAVEE